MAAQQVIGVDVGGTKILAGVLDRGGQLGRHGERPTPITSQDAFFAALDEVVEELRDEPVDALGFGLPSTIDQAAGRAVSSVHVPLTDVPFRERMTERYGVPVGIDNDGNAAAIAEWQVGAGRGTRNMIMLTLGTGIGGGLILGGKPFRGATGAGAELGHMVLEFGGPPCGHGCDGHGHFEALASGSAADAEAARLFGKGTSGQDLASRAREGDPTAVAAMNEIGQRLGAGLASLINVFEPELIVLGGGFASARDLLLGPAQEVIAVEALRPGRCIVRIVPAELGTRAGLVGAGLIAFEALDK